MSAKARTPRLAMIAMLISAVAGCAGATAPTSRPGTPAPSGPATGASQGVDGIGSTPATGGGSSGDACSLLTADDISAVTGYAISKATPTSPDMVFPSGCEWELDAPNEVVPPSIVLGIQRSGGKAYFDSYFKPFASDEGNQPVADLGDAAIDVGFGAVVVLKGDTLFNLQYIGQDKHQVELARTLLAHL